MTKVNKQNQKYFIFPKRNSVILFWSIDLEASRKSGNAFRWLVHVSERDVWGHVTSLFQMKMVPYHWTMEEKNKAIRCDRKQTKANMILVKSCPVRFYELYSINTSNDSMETPANWTLPKFSKLQFCIAKHFNRTAAKDMFTSICLVKSGKF